MIFEPALCALAATAFPIHVRIRIMFSVLWQDCVHVLETMLYERAHLLRGHKQPGGG